MLRTEVRVQSNVRTKLVLNDSYFLPVICCEDMVDQSRFPGPQKPGHNGHWDARHVIMLVSHIAMFLGLTATPADLCCRRDLQRSVCIERAGLIDWWF